MHARHELYAAAVVLMLAAPAAAQTSVGASLVGDVARFSHAGLNGGEDAGGEALGFALRVGTGVGAAWGVELEFARPSAIEFDMAPEIVPLALQSGVTLAGRPGIVTTDVQGPIYPPIRYRIRTEIRHTTLGASAWVRQDVSSRVSLIYLGGVGFVRAERNIEYDISGVLTPLVLPGYRSEAITLGVGASVGFETRVRLTEHAQLVPGLRLQALEDGWLVRPSVGLAWEF
jgi:hypothetical protein